jgi:hypothetical protein
MRSSTSFELWRWIYHVILFFVGTGLIVLIGELLVGPLLQWQLYNVPYHLPTLNRAGRWTLGVLFIGFIAGTLSWYYEKNISGR